MDGNDSKSPTTASLSDKHAVLLMYSLSSRLPALVVSMSNRTMSGWGTLELDEKDLAHSVVVVLSGWTRVMSNWVEWLSFSRA